ncbi:MAG: CusA/CzcA family heavy metal efflux RND transporter [Flavobacteriales bacterium]|nr:CusA/CzcA family heavy metal efflux RND transporter [Flavobacteriales bacterium]
MLSKIINYSIKNKLIVAIGVIALTGIGAYQTSKLPIDAVPDITDNQVQVITVSPSLGAPDVERLITFPIEQANSNIPGLKEIRSFSRFGLSLITIVFHDNVDIYWARQQVTERIKMAEQLIPPGVGSPELAPVTTGLGEIYQYVVRPAQGYEKKYDPVALRTIQDWLVRRQLLSVEGVADVSSFGGLVKQYEVAIDPERLNSYHVSILDIFSALEKNNENTGGSYIEKGPAVLYIRSEGLISSLEDIANITVKTFEDGTPVFIKDVAKVQFGNATRYGAITYNDQGEVAGAVVMMLKGENSNKVIAGVKERIAEIQKNLPEGVILEPFLDRTKMVNNAIGTVTKNLLEGALIVLFILVLFLGNFRAGILVASVILLSMLFAVIMMNIFGVSGNLMSLGALDFGLIVDGAVIIVEAVMHSIVHHKSFAGLTRINQHQMDETVGHSASRMMNSAVFGQIIILVVYLPIFTLEGIEGKMFKPMAQTVAFALLGAFILSLTYIPMMSAFFLSKKLDHHKTFSDRMMDVLIRWQQNMLHFFMKYPRTILTGVLALFITSIFLFTTLGAEFIPELPEGDFAVDTRVLNGSNIHTSIEATTKSSHLLLNQFPEIEKIVAKTGSGEIPTDPMPMEASDMMIILKDKSEWTSAKTWEELSAKMSATLSEIPGVTYSFQYPVAMRFNELMTGAKQDVVCKIFGENLDTLAKYSVKLGELVSQVEGASNIYVEPLNGTSQLIIRYKRESLAQYGIHVQDVNRVLNTAFAGQTSGQVYEEEKRYDLVVRMDKTLRQNQADLENLLIPTNRGTQVPLHMIADVKTEQSVNQIQRTDAKRRIVVGFNVSGRDVESIVNDLKKIVDTSLNLPSGYFVTYGGAFENLAEAKQRLSIAVPISLLLILVLLYFAFHSIKHGLLIYSAIPLSAIGGILFLVLRGMPFSISAGVGFIALFGVAVLNGIVLLAEFNRIKEHGEQDLHKIVLLGTKHRLRPVLMTAFVASLGFLPMAISHGAGAEVQRPLATVVIGGLLIATLLTIFVLPLLYILFETKAKRRKTSHKTAVAILMVFGLHSWSSNAQTYISLDQSISIALENNLLLKNEHLRTDQKQHLEGTAADLSKTLISTEYGQFNSYYQDNKIGVSQNFQFPLIYYHQKELLTAITQNQNYSAAVVQAEIIKSVRESFCKINYLRNKIELYQLTDSIYEALIQHILYRFDAGAADITQLTLAQEQRNESAVALSLIKADLESEQYVFHQLLNTPENLLPDQSNYSDQIPEGLSSDNFAQHPIIRIAHQQNTIAKSQVAVQKSQTLPDLFIGAYSSTIQGVGANDIFYTKSQRFNTVQFGISIPLFYKASHSRIKSAKLEQEITQNQTNIVEQEMQRRFSTALKKHELLKKISVNYENASLARAEQILQSANELFLRGESGYLEWSMLMNQYVRIKSNYLDTEHELQKTVIELQYLLTK